MAAWWGWRPSLASSCAPFSQINNNKTTTIKNNTTNKQWFRFPAWLGANSTAGKQKRLLAELATNLAASGHVHAGRGDVRMLYVPVLRELLTRPIAARGEDGVADVVAVMRVRPALCALCALPFAVARGASGRAAGCCGLPRRPAKPSPPPHRRHHLHTHTQYNIMLHCTPPPHNRSTASRASSGTSSST